MILMSRGAHEALRRETTRRGGGAGDVMMDGGSIRAPAPRRAVSLADRYDLAQGEVLLSGVQALLRAALMQAARDRRAGLDTAGYITGYRGSPLGGVDLAAGRAATELAAAQVRFEPALNEDLAATAIWGAQQAGLRAPARHDGVFALWYGKGPGVDRSGDVFRHANLAGAARHGGVVCALGDDHTCESSTTCHQSDIAMMDAQMPLLHPAGPQEILDYAQIGWALSRATGLWVGLKCVKDTVEATSVVEAGLDRLRLRTPTLEAPPQGLTILRGETPQQQEARLAEWRLPAAAPFARANGLDRRSHGAPGARMGVIASGKSWLDVVEALALLGLDEAALRRLGVTIGKPGLAWPIDQDGLRRFANGLSLLIVIEEKRAFLEPQIKTALYGAPGAPRILGKCDEAGAPMLRSHLDLDPIMIAEALGAELLREIGENAEPALLARLRGGLAETRARRAEAERLANAAPLAERSPYFCAGCPHNRSTLTPDGARAYAGIGCHYMAQWMERETEGYTHMGGEGAQWIGEAPFSKERHVFQNMGDGTFNHSGLMAVRAAAASGVSITFKILYNDAVAMTGGQANDGGLTPQRAVAELLAAGVRRVDVVGEESELSALSNWPAAARIRARRELDAAQRELAEIKGATALVYVQTCAAEKRRRRRKGLFPQPEARVFINPEVCEGCGDCGQVSNCVAIQPLETPLGAKRRIDQSACNQDLSCVDGLCPSFVTVAGALPRRPEAAPRAALDDPSLPEPTPPALADREGWRVLLAGVGGTGVITSAAILAQAAHIEGKGADMMEMAGLAQKGGAVLAHLRLTAAPGAPGAARTPPGAADALIAGDLAVGAGPKSLAALKKGRARAVADLDATPPAAFTRDASLRLPSAALQERLAAQLAPGGLTTLDATALAAQRLGDGVLGASVLLGAAWQQGLLPLSRAAIVEAIRLNGVAVEGNLAAFALGRQVVADPAAVARAAPAAPAPQPLAELIADRAERLEAYQDRRWAERYRSAVATVARAEAAATPGAETITRNAAQALAKLMSYKDEYEVARLHHAYTARLAETLFESAPGARMRLGWKLSPPLLTRPGPDGRPPKLSFGPWMGAVFGLLRHGKALRGGPLDPFGWTEERRLERALITLYEKDLRRIARRLRPANAEAAAALAAWPLTVKGFGAVKARAVDRASAERRAALERFRGAERGPEAGSG
ncbi:MAG: indolepyruvate ferredoxin oxidoreductase family protein [Pseudomonadota bacterium]